MQYSLFFHKMSQKLLTFNIKERAFKKSTFHYENCLAAKAIICELFNIQT